MNAVPSERPTVDNAVVCNKVKGGATDDGSIIFVFLNLPLSLDGGRRRKGICP